MGDELFVGLIVAALSGITFLAYRDPPVFEKVNRFIGGLIIAAVVGGAFWNQGIVKTLKTLMPYVAPEQGARAIDAAEELILPSWYLLVALGMSVYCILLPVLFRTKKSSANRSKD